MCKKFLAFSLSLLILCTLFSGCGEKLPSVPETPAGAAVLDVYQKLVVNFGDPQICQPFIVGAKSPDERVAIQWESSNPEALTVSNYIITPTRPQIGQEPAKVTLTATITSEDVTVTRSFDVEVKPLKEAETYHVSKSGSDKNPGTEAKPFLTINKAAQIADTGDTVIIGEGVYREYVNPARGGIDEDSRITYKAKDGEQVMIKGSDVLTGLKQVEDGVYKAKLDTKVFGGYNPYTIKFGAQRYGTLGEVFVDSKPYDEVSNLDLLMSNPNSWFTNEAGDELHVNFGDTDPAGALVEYNVREQVFAPYKYGIGYITVSGISIEHAANQYPVNFWEFAGASQKGALSTGGGHHWIIENCDVGFAKAVNIDFGYMGVSWLNELFPLYPQPDSGVKGNMGFHIVRNNNVHDAGTTGIAGCWSAYSQVRNNIIVNNNRFDNVSGYEAGGLKTHHFLSGTVADNYFENNNFAGYWMDDTGNESRITGNVFVNEPDLALYVELTTGSVLIDSNVILNGKIRVQDTSGTRLVNNLILYDKPTGLGFDLATTRKSDNFLPNNGMHMGSPWIHIADNGVYKNYFVKTGLNIPPNGEKIHDNLAESNLYTDGGARSADYESFSIVASESTPISWGEENGQLVLSITPTAQAFEFTSPMPGWMFTPNIYNGSSYMTPQDFYGNPISNLSPAGPFADLKAGENRFVLFPKLERTFVVDRPYIINNTFIGNDQTIYNGEFTYLHERMLGDFGGDVHMTETDGDNIELNFTGTGLMIIGEANQNPPVLEITVDGQVMGEFTPTANKATVQNVFYRLEGLNPGEHKVLITKKSGGPLYYDGYFVQSERYTFPDLG